MSGRLQNLLDNYSSYSTHYVMLACRTTQAARDFSLASSTDTLQAIDDTEYLGEPVVWKGSTSDVFLVMDTRRFSQFTVEKFENEVFINGIEKGGSHGNLCTEVKMTIVDSVGISFMNYLQWLLDTRMECGFDGMVFMLRVVFVGHKDAGTLGNTEVTEVAQTVTIPMTLQSLSVNLDYAKGIYDCVFQPNFNFNIIGGNRWLNIGRATNYKGVTGNLLGPIVQSFEDALNFESNKFFQSAGGTGRKVKYMITLPKDWEKMQWDGGSVENALERDFAKKQDTQKQDRDNSANPGTTSTPSLVSFSSADKGSTITEVLDIMFKQVNAIRLLAANDPNNPAKPIVFYKHLVSISSDLNNFTVHVDVILFSVPNVRPQKPNEAPTFDESQKKFYVQRVVDGVPIWQPKNYCEFDYIFTGKNADILNFDMKIENLQFLLSASVRVGEGRLFGDSLADGQLRQVGSTKNGPLANTDTNLRRDKAGSVREVYNTRKYDPVLIPLVIGEEKQNFSHYVVPRKDGDMKVLIDTSLAYAQNLSAFYARSPITVNMRIKGNPAIFEKFNFDVPTLHTTSNTSTGTAVSTADIGSKADYRRDLEQNILRITGATAGTSPGTFAVDRPLGDESYATSPVFVKINIKGPNVDPRSNALKSELVDGEDFAKEVLYNNFYRVMRVKNTIESGVFSQELEMMGHNVFGETNP